MARIDKTYDGAGPVWVVTADTEAAHVESAAKIPKPAVTENQ